MLTDNIAVWPDGTWCYGEDLEDYLNPPCAMSDDFEELVWDTPKYQAFMYQETGDMSVLPDQFISVYMPIAGWKAIMYAVDDECGGHHTPWATGEWAYGTKEEAILNAKAWAEAEDLEFFDTVRETADAPRISVTEQLRKMFPEATVISLD